MLAVRDILDNKEAVVKGLQKKRFKNITIIDEIVEMDSVRKNIQTQLDNLLAEANNIAKEIGALYKEGKKESAESAKQRSAEIKDLSKQLAENLAETEKQLTGLLTQVPNIPHSSVPEGVTPEENLEIRTGGSMPQLPLGHQPHWELIQKYDLIDFEMGTKLTGAGFPVYKGKGAKLQRALISFFLDEAEKQGYQEVIPPILVNEASGFGTGQLPDKEAQMYYVQEDNLYLIPTAEVPVTNMYRDVIVEAEQLPIKNTAYTPCFRREAGAWGKKVRGLNRLHQFDKVEIVRIEHPDRSYQALEEMVEYVESLVIKLGLPYRIIRLCGGDMGFTSALTYDFEVFSAAQEMWLEVSSVSNFESYQANRLKLRFREKGEKKTLLAHTLNGSALALPRILAAILENNQTEDGIKIPAVLVKYTGFDTI